MGSKQTVAPGMVVVGSDGTAIGRVKDVRADGIFRVDCRFSPDYYIPAHAVHLVDANTVTLRCSKAQAAYMGWEAKPQEPGHGDE